MHDAHVATKANFVHKTDNIYIIVSPDRPNSSTFVIRLEHEHFPPRDQVKNGLFELYSTKFNGLPFIVVGVPRSDIGICQALASDLELKLVIGIPASEVITDTGQTDRRHFNISHSPDSTYTLQNTRTYTDQERFDAITSEHIKLTAYMDSLDQRGDSSEGEDSDDGVNS